MQDRFVGDVGDFGKYGLLKALCGNDLSLGVVWYLIPDEEGGDGSRVGYLNPTPDNVRRFEACDPSLYRTLGGIVRDGARRVRSVREREVLPPDTTFYEERLFFEDAQGAESRLEHRKAWAWDALAAVRGCDVVFADPDNGLEVTSVQPHYGKAPKYAYFDELAPYAERGQSLVIYQHRTHTPVDVQVQDRLSQLNDKFGGAFALLYPSRIFLVVPSESHRALLVEHVESFLSGPWSQHFTLIESRSLLGGGIVA